MTEQQYHTLEALSGAWSLEHEIAGTGWVPDSWRHVMPSCERNGWVEVARHNGNAVAWRITKTGAMATFLSAHAGWTPEEAHAIWTLGKLAPRPELARPLWQLPGVAEETLVALHGLEMVYGHAGAQWCLTREGYETYQYAMGRPRCRTQQAT